MVKLRCGVYGEGSVFSVEMELSAEVEALQKAIFKDQRYRRRFSFPPSAVTLYMAHSNGAWLKDDRSVETVLLAGKTAEYEQMRPSWRLDDEKLFGKAFYPGANEIQILVELPTWQSVVSTEMHQTEMTCREFLNVLAHELYALYDFDFDDKVPTIDDVFGAVETGVWAFRMNKYQPVATTELPDLFTAEEWKALKQLDIATTREEKPYIILPHHMFSDDQVSIFKAIAAKSNLVVAPTELDVLEEDFPGE